MAVNAVDDVACDQLGRLQAPQAVQACGQLGEDRDLGECSAREDKSAIAEVRNKRTA
jgi:hypothetical protein